MGVWENIIYIIDVFRILSLFKCSPCFVMNIYVLCWSYLSSHANKDDQYQTETINDVSHSLTLIARFIGPTWGPSGADRIQVGPHVGPMNFAIWEGIPLQLETFVEETMICTVKLKLFYIIVIFQKPEISMVQLFFNKVIDIVFLKFWSF